MYLTPGFIDLHTHTGGEPTRVGYRMKDDHKVRTCHKCGKDVDR